MSSRAAEAQCGLSATATAGTGTLGDLGNLTTNYLTLNNFGFNILMANLPLKGYATDSIVQLATINSATSLTLLGTNQAVTGDPAGITLHWTAGAIGTANEFVVQRSADGITWEDLATLDALTAVETYSYTDSNPLAGPNYYRLELLDAGNISGYSITAIISTRTAADLPPGMYFLTVDGVEATKVAR